MADKKIESSHGSSEEKSLVAYTFGIISIVLAFFQPLAGLIFGIIGLVQSKKSQNDLSRKAKKMNIIGIVLSIIVFVVTIVFMLIVAKSTGTNPLSSLTNYA